MGQWTIFCGTDMDSINTTFCTSEYEGSGFVDQARARFVGSGVAADCDLDQTRREAADRVLVRKGARSLGARTDGTHESTVGNAPSGVIRGDKPGQRQPTPVRDVARKLGRINGQQRWPTFGFGLISVRSVVQLYPGPYSI